DLDRAVELYPRLVEFLRQDMRQAVPHREALVQLATLFVNNETTGADAPAPDNSPA
ncbi:MAG: hypothetical protein KJO38_03570, partial [Gammaproteobacteria bacterium]|nr:hypothetical protein [Gammaproteobacteria bacterium]